MRVDQNPIHRKVIVPWYDSDAACIMILVAMGLVLLFSICGIQVSREIPEYAAFGWVAMVLLGLSGWVMASIGFRLMKRRSQRSSN